MNGKTALVTGVSSGLGKVIAQKFKDEGFQVIGISRSKPDIELDKWIKCDLTDKESRNKTISEIKEQYQSLNVLVNNAGRGVYESWNNTDEEDLRNLFELNFFALIDLSKKFLPMLNKAHGTIINISSVAGHQYVPFMGPYCATKAAVSMFSNSFRAEHNNDGVKILNVTPGRIPTDFSKNASGGMTPPDTPGSRTSPEHFANAVFKAFTKGKRSLIYPWWYRFFLLVSKIFPKTYDSINLRIWKKQSK